MNKDELLQLLKNGNIDEFNKSRPKEIDLSESDFNGCELKGANLSLADLTGTDFCDSYIKEVDFTKSDLTSVNFTNAVIKNADFSNTILNGVKFNYSTLKDSDFTEADMSGADFSEAIIERTDLSLSENLPECIFDSGTQWPDEEYLPADFEAEYIADLASLHEDEDIGHSYEY